MQLKLFKRLHGRLFYSTIFQTIDICVYMMKIYFQSIDFLRNGSGRFGAVKSYSTSHFFGNACTKSGPLRFSQFSGFSVILLLPLFPCNVPCRVFSYDSHLFPVYSQNVKYISTGTISKCHKYWKFQWGFKKIQQQKIE